MTISRTIKNNGNALAGVVVALGEGTAMIESMATVHMADNEVSNNFAAVLENIRKGVEVIVEQDHLPVALIRSLAPQGRLLSDCIVVAEARGSSVTPDEGFTKDVEEGVANRRQPWNPPTLE